MMLVALLARPWVLRVRRTGAVPRVLADDMRVYAHGAQAGTCAIQAFRVTLDFVHDIGGAVAPTK
eukprot:10213737-Lingulodinium_polyedra.AAC.1